MEQIWTSKGFITAHQLTHTTGEIDNENEHTTWEEWRDSTGEIVKRNVHVRLKKGSEFVIEQGTVG